MSIGLFHAERAGAGLAQAAPAIAAPAQLSQLRTERSEDGLFVTATVNFELPTVVEDALLKGIPLFFLVEADVYQGERQ